MPNVLICDADNHTRLDPLNAKPYGFGIPHYYSPKAEDAVDVYVRELLAAANDARALFQTRRVAAAKEFHKRYPDGVLPDEVSRAVAEVEEEENDDAVG